MAFERRFVQLARSCTVMSGMNLIDEVEDDVSIPFAVIEDVPVFPGCEKAKGAAAIRDCFNEQMQKHIRKNFRYPEIAQ